MSSSVSLFSLKTSTIYGCLATFPFLFLKFLPIGAISTFIGSAASSDCVLVVYGGLAEGLGCGLSALRRATPIFCICTRARRMWVFCCELLVSHDPHGIARCGRLRKSHRSMLWNGYRSVLVDICRLMFEI
ncbi:hypothetical protein F2Q69_00052668 [Brassica cretica]|uniref:Uncharacterized protein n=1 Tax=Brassica cretica TaxID=69181 RepID=A0A8S9MTW4_BRACR|nr:hypothetical protein F2Q69_00052668 [Brassica cretica]